MLSEGHATLWAFAAGEALMFFAWLIGSTIYLGKILSRFDDALSRLGKVEERTERMDSHGTLFSQFNLKTELEKITAMIGRVDKLEANARKLDVIADRVENINEHLGRQQK